VTIRRKHVGNQPSKAAPVRLSATLLVCDAMAGPSSRSDYTSGARLRDLEEVGALHIVYFCFKREKTLSYTIFQIGQQLRSHCAVTCFSMTIATTIPILISSNNLEGSKGWTSLSVLLLMIPLASDSKANISGIMLKARSLLVELPSFLSYLYNYTTGVRILSYNQLSLGRMPVRLFLAC